MRLFDLAHGRKHKGKWNARNAKSVLALSGETSRNFPASPYRSALGAARGCIRSAAPLGVSLSAYVCALSTVVLEEVALRNG